jgi:hypothetical protein
MPDLTPIGVKTHREYLLLQKALASFMRSFEIATSLEQAQGLIDDLDRNWERHLRNISFYAYDDGLHQGDTMLINLGILQSIPANRIQDFRDFLFVETRKALIQPKLITNQMRKALDDVIVSRYGASQWDKEVVVRNLLRDTVGSPRIRRPEMLNGRFTGKWNTSRWRVDNYAKMYTRTRSAEIHTIAIKQRADADGLDGFKIDDHYTRTPRALWAPSCSEHVLPDGRGKVYSRVDIENGVGSLPPYHPNCLHTATPIKMDMYK